MQPFKYVPTICQGKEAEWSGYVMLKPVSFDQRFQYIEESGFDMDLEKGDIKIDMSLMGPIRKLVKFSSKHYTEVCLKKGDQKVNSLEDMEYTDELHMVLIEVATKVILGGNKPGKKLKSS